METAADTTSPGSDVADGLDGLAEAAEFLVGQTVPYQTSDSPEWGQVGGSGGRGGGGGVGVGSGRRVSSVASMAEQSRGPGDLSGGGDALLQVWDVVLETLVFLMAFFAGVALTPRCRFFTVF